jgi:hypothetical protein
MTFGANFVGRGGVPGDLHSLLTMTHIMMFHCLLAIVAALVAIQLIRRIDWHQETGYRQISGQFLTPLQGF